MAATSPELTALLYCAVLIIILVSSFDIGIRRGSVILCSLLLFSLFLTTPTLIENHHHQLFILKKEEDD
jgi:hypothetical protein